MSKVTDGILLIISGPSGVGKGSVCAALIAKDKNTVFSVSATTRSPRKGEVNGKDYYFISKEEFLQKRARGDFLEWAEVFGNYYGTPVAEIQKLLKEGKNVLLDIETQGASQIRSVCPEGVSVFILPPSFEELERRIVTRGSETEEMRKIRLSQAKQEIQLAEQYDFCIVNTDIEETANAVLDIIAKVKAERQLHHD